MLMEKLYGHIKVDFSVCQKNDVYYDISISANKIAKMNRNI